MKKKDEDIVKKWLADELEEQGLTAEEQERLRLFRKIDKVLAENKAPEYDVEQALSSLHQQKPEKGGKLVSFPIHKWGLGIAASLLILFAFYFLFNLQGELSSPTVKMAKAGEKLEFNLPDSSKVWLNSGSVVRYNEADWTDNRILTLHGEAYFEVKKGTSFQVQTDQGLVTVLGTKFNVFDRKKLFEVNCFEGSVRVLVDSEKEVLTAGKGIKLLDKNITTLQVKGKGNPSWLEDRSEFNSIPLSYVLEEVERQFNLTVQSKNIDLGQNFTGSFSHGDLQLALKTISLSTGTSYEIKDKKTVLFYSERD